MYSIGAENEFSPRHARRRDSSAGRVYVRLVRYAWDYKFRLAVSLLFAVVVAASFGSMVLTAGGVVRVIFGQEEAVREQVDGVADRLESFTGRVERITGWAVGKDLAEDFRNLVKNMRARKMVALGVLSAAVLVLMLVANIARFLQEYYAGSIGASISIRLIRQMYENVVGQSLAFFERRPTGELLARFTNDVFMVNRGLTSVFVKLLREPFKALVFLALALSVDPLLTVVGLCVLPPVVYIIVRIGRQVKKNVSRSLDAWPISLLWPRRPSRGSLS